MEGVRLHEWRPADTRGATAPESAHVGSGGAPATGVTALDRAAELLDAGGVLAHPTSTVYGLGGRPREAVDGRIAALKGRPLLPLIRLAASREALGAALPAVRWTETGRRLADALWPGPLTLILDDGSEAGIAVRVDAHAVVRRLLERAGGLMTSTSLNLTGGAPARTRGEAREALASMPQGAGWLGWLDAGDLPASAPSTLVRPGSETVDVLREGAVPVREIERLAGGVVRRGVRG